METKPGGLMSWDLAAECQAGKLPLAGKGTSSSCHRQILRSSLQTGVMQAELNEAVAARQKDWTLAKGSVCQCMTASGTAVA